MFANNMMIQLLQQVLPVYVSKNLKVGGVGSDFSCPKCGGFIRVSTHVGGRVVAV